MSHQVPFAKVEDLGAGNFGDDETEETRNTSNSNLHAQQVNMIDDQENSLEGLATIVHNQKRIARAIDNEVVDQDDLLIDIRDRTADTNAHLQQQTRNVAEATRKSSTCGYWLIILLLLIAIIIVAVW